MRGRSEKTIVIGDVDSEGLLELSVSKVKKWRTCQQAYDYKYNQKLSPKTKAVPLRRGTWVHACLEARDNGENWVEVIKKLKAEEYDKLFVEEKAELGDLPAEVFRIMRAYHQTYQLIDAEYETVVCEQSFMIRIPGTTIVLTGIIDKIMRHKSTGKIWCVEHKTMKNTPPTEEFRITDIQTANYTWVMEQIAPHLGFKREDIAGVIFDYIKTKPPTIPDTLKNGELSKRKNIDCDKWTYLACIKRAGLDPANYEDILTELEHKVFFQRIPMAKSVPMVKLVLQEIINTGTQIQALSPHCLARNLNWTCDRPKCEYRDLCIADLQGADTQTLINLQFERREEDGNKERTEDESND